MAGPAGGWCRALPLLNRRRAATPVTTMKAPPQLVGSAEPQVTELVETGCPGGTAVLGRRPSAAAGSRRARREGALSGHSPGIAHFT